jgi:hypothetical protein
MIVPLSRSWCLLPLLGSFSVPCVLPAQKTIEISAERTRPTHALRIVPRVTLSDVESPVEDGELAPVAIDRRGRYYMIAGGEQRVLVFDSTGRFLETFGRKGRGPGEYQLLKGLFIGPGDSIYLVERMARTTLLTPDYKVVKTFESGDFRSGIRFRNNRIAHLKPNREDPNWIHTFEIMELSGRSLKRIEVGRRAKENGIGMRTWDLAEGIDASIWLTAFGFYQAEQWDSAGRHLRTVKRKPDGPAFNAVPATDLSEVLLRSIATDPEGRLWFMTAVPNGKTVRRRVRMESGFKEMDVPLRDLIIEVIDPRANRLVASQRFDYTHPCWFMDGGLISCHETQEDGNVVFPISQVQLVRMK